MIHFNENFGLFLGNLSTIPLQNSTGTIYAYLDVRADELTTFSITPNNSSGELILDYQYPDTNGLNYSFTTNLRAAPGYEGLQIEVVEKIDADATFRNEESDILIEHNLVRNPIVSTSNASITYVNPNFGSLVSLNDEINSNTTINTGYNSGTAARELDITYTLFAGSLNAVKYNYIYKDKNNETAGTDRRVWSLPNFTNQLICSDINTDGTGEVNRFDLDSDDDGCSDAAEASATKDSTTNFKFNSISGEASDSTGDGLADAVDSADDGNPDYTSTYTTYAISDLVNGCHVDLSIKKTVVKAVPKVGDEIIFSIVLKNIGLAYATGVQVKDILPAGLTYVAANSVIPINTTYTSGSGIWDLTNITIEDGGSIELKIAAIVNTKGTIITNKAEVFIINQTDKDSTPNSDN